MGTINFNSLPRENSSMYAVIPKGCYCAKIVKSEMKPSKNGKPDYLSAECDVTDPASGTGMGKFWINLFESEANLPRFQLRRFIEAVGLNITGEFELKDLTKMINGKSLLVDICPNKEGDRSVVDISADCFYPIAMASPDAVAEEINAVFTAPMAPETAPPRASSY